MPQIAVDARSPNHASLAPNHPSPAAGTTEPHPIVGIQCCWSACAAGASLPSQASRDQGPVRLPVATRSMSGVTAEHVTSRLKENLQASDAVVHDVSGGCGTSFEVAVISPLFEGKTLIARHRLVHEALAEEMPSIHALSIKRAWTPEQSQKQQAQAAAAAGKAS